MPIRCVITARASSELLAVLVKGVTSYCGRPRSSTESSGCPDKWRVFVVVATLRCSRRGSALFAGDRSVAPRFAVSAQPPFDTLGFPTVSVEVPVTRAETAEIVVDSFTSG